MPKIKFTLDAEGCPLLNGLPCGDHIRTELWNFHDIVTELCENGVEIELPESSPMVRDFGPDPQST